MSLFGCFEIMLLCALFICLFSGVVSVLAFAEGERKLGAFLLVIFIIGLCLPTVIYQPEPDIVSTWNLRSLDDSSSISGSFFLGTGTVNSNAVFVCYGQLPDGGYKLLQIPASQSRIYMNSENAQLKVITDACENQRYEFHVPSNTIVQRYELDSKL